MNSTDCAAVWFGPGGSRGVFGAGVARGLQHAIADQRLDTSCLRLCGASVGCLTAAYLATGNTHCGLDVFCEDAPKVVTAGNLLPSVAAQTMNRAMHAMGRRPPLVSVPQVLQVDRVIELILQRIPDIVLQLRQAPIPNFAECVDRRTGEFCHIDLRTAADPLQTIRGALNLVPLASQDTGDLLDAVIKGYGFTRLLNGEGTRRLVVVLNRGSARSRLERMCCHLWAAMSGDPRIARLYGQRDRECVRALQMAASDERVLLVTPDAEPTKKNIRQVYDCGIAAAARVVDFLRR